ncbi:hypothetical protein PR202_gb14807 [Eleusine coracana subsp. coracana]|uniref:Uncharacterized protein n=1 Tax=Eleusine coracana subsp. coracana TaxID=191504 RepID=A0AAV5EW47_ELECO|nr:hypothetical protein PR202_gb14807 [Eleusine coracana subsp. coracana]
MMSGTKRAADVLLTEAGDCRVAAGGFFLFFDGAARGGLPALGMGGRAAKGSFVVAPSWVAAVRRGGGPLPGADEPSSMVGAGHAWWSRRLVVVRGGGHGTQSLPQRPAEAKGSLAGASRWWTDELRRGMATSGSGTTIKRGGFARGAIAREAIVVPAKEISG